MPITTNAADALQNTPDGLRSVNALGSEFAQTFSQAQSGHYQWRVEYDITDDSPKRYMDLAVLKNFNTEGNDGDEINWMEKPWARVPAEVTAAALAVAPGPGFVDQDVVTNAAALQVFKVDRGVVYPDGTFGTVIAVNTGTNTLTIQSQTGEGLPALADGDFLTDAGVAGVDGLWRLQMTQRSEYINITNYIEMIGSRSLRYDRKELIKAQRLAQTNKLAMDQKDCTDQLMVDISAKIWLGKKGQMGLSDGSTGKNTAGIIDQMQTGGSAFLTATSATAWDVLTDAVFATDHTAEGTTRFIFGTPRAIHNLNITSGKQTLVRYEPNDMIRNLDLKSYVFEGRNFVLVEVPLWQDIGTFPAIYQNRLVVMEPNLVNLVLENGIPMVEEWNLLSKMDTPKGSIYDSMVRGWRGNIGVKVRNRPAHFVMDIP